MNKSSRRWKVFVIVLCMLFTMTPGMVFADDVVDPPAIDQPLNNDGNPPEPGTPPEGGDPLDTLTPPAIPDPVTPPDYTTPPAIPDPDMPIDSDMQMLNFMPLSSGTTLTLFYREDNTVGNAINIKSVSYVNNPSGVTTLTNPHTINIPNSFFGLDTHKNYNAVNYVPNIITDMDNNNWVLNDQGQGQKTIQIWKGQANEHTFHYKELPPPPTTGSITINKKITGDTPASSATFSFTLTGPDNYSYDFTITGKGSETISGLKKGDYWITETNIPANYTALNNGSKITLSEAKKSFDFYNKYKKPTTLTIHKEIIGNPGTPATFTFDIDKCVSIFPLEYQDYTTVTIKGQDSKTIDVDKGYYKIKEIDIPENYDVISFNPQEKWIDSGESQGVTFKNKYTGPTTGGITITKNVTGGGVIPKTVFNFSITGPDTYTKTVSITGGGEPLTIDNLKPGNYKVTESETDHFWPDDNDFDRDVEVKAGLTASVEFTNVYSVGGPTTGGITIIKTIEGDKPADTDTFTFKILDDNETVIAQINVSGETSETAINIPPGTYTVTENPHPGYTPRVNGQKVTVSAGVTSMVPFINDYDAPAEPVIIKEVALYDGEGIPESGFGKSLTLTDLNKSVIYRISFDNPKHVLVDLNDIYDFDGAEENITNVLQVLYDGKLVAPDGFYMDGTYYYIDTLTAIGTYTNIIKILGSENQVLDSSSAFVTVSETPPGPGPGPDPDPPKHNGDGGTHYYEVTYDPNYPTGAEIAGTVPKDTNDYTYNSKVSVRGNTGDLKAGTYTFISWNTKADGTGTMYLPGNTFNIKEDTILYAQWKLSEEPVAAVPGTDDGAAVSAETAGLDDVPKTGTTTPFNGMFLLGLLSLAAITVLGRKKLIV